MTKRLGREKQCAKCPWKVETDPRDISNGYCESAHRALEGTIATHLQIGGTIKVMACHESPIGKETECIGWLINQLGPGNNIVLRISMLGYDLSGVKVFGEQHQIFADTLP